MTENADNGRVIVAPDGQPARRPTSSRCPRCGAGKDKRVNAAGFGPPVLVCSQCGCHVEEGS